MVCYDGAMVINTRNFLLYLLSVGFLILAITYTATSSSPQRETASFVLPPAETMREYGAEAVVTPALNRSEMLAAMREKIAHLSSSLQASVSEAQPRVPDEEEQNIDEVGVGSTVLTCADYEVAQVAWQPQGATFAVVEGARLLTRTVTVATTTASGTVMTDTYREVLAQLPLRSFPLPMKSCLPTDVVGIALDGSLIRNDEVSLYTIFGADTLLGYALDGFPLYGTNDTLTLDECGGAVVAGQYRYYLSAKREAILYCYAGIPIDL